jgi:orotate phosphoribosyltransferase-like protein
MAMIFTIDLIEGNSHIGVPVFSSSAKKENKNWMVFSQPKRPKNLTEEEDDDGTAGPVSKDFNRGDKVSLFRS